MEGIFRILNIRTRHNRTYKPIFIDIATEEGVELNPVYEEEYIDDTYNEDYNEKIRKKVWWILFDSLEQSCATFKCGIGIWEKNQKTQCRGEIDN
jgi:hypothetical protein